ncbi:hypothetical protein [Lawsonibacter faecis]|uniref:Uncharacterized protein n=1 Tax=Lawsonibacter faecis TaxID=2763052 RepID=A0A8J6JJF8_9FIRM|nr:hypothetical protein [Lawsonibacter faecis]MBC5736374.1 hypothetical protein [Lawsonibacter faecis]
MSKLNLKGRGPGALLSLGCAALGVVCLAAYCVYGAVFDYFDTGVCIALLLAAACAGVYALAEGKPLGALNLVSAACLSFALGLFFLNSFPVWADNLNGITMYASRGGLAPVVAIAAVMLACILAEIVSCFLSRGKGDAK